MPLLIPHNLRSSEFIEHADCEIPFVWQGLATYALIQNMRLQTSKLNERQSLCLVGTVICLDYVMQTHYYCPIFDKRMMLSLSIMHF